MDALIVKKRDLNEKAKLVRNRGEIPANYFGKKVKNRHFTMDYQTFLKLYRVARESTVIDIKEEGAKSTLKVLVQDVQLNPVNNEIMHVDFIKVNMKEEVTATIPVKFVGEADAIRILGGMLITQKDEVTIKCLPDNLVNSLDADISKLVDFDAVIHVSDLNAPKDVQILDNPDDVLAMCRVTRAVIEDEEEETSGDEEGATENAEGGDEASDSSN